MLIIIAFYRDQWLGSVRNYAKHLRIDGVKDTIAIASGKGGVGKSTTAGKNSLQFAAYSINALMNNLFQ